MLTRLPVVAPHVPWLKWRAFASIAWMLNETSNAMDTISADLQAQVGANLHRFREKQGLTQEHLAHAAGLATRHLQKIEAGQVNVTLRTLGRLGSALNVEASVFLKGSDDGMR